jgi:hypothetical protein
VASGRDCASLKFVVLYLSLSRWTGRRFYLPACHKLIVGRNYKQDHMRTRKVLTIICIIANCFNLFGQEIDLNHFPTKTSQVTEEEYRKGRHILTNSYQAIKEDSRKLVYLDYWNVAMGSSLMGEDKEVVFKLLETSKSKAPSKFCQIVQKGIEMKNGNVEELQFYRLFGDRFVKLISDCRSLNINDINSKQDPKLGVDLTNLNVTLIDSLIVMMERDQKFRYKNSEYDNNTSEQSSLDNKNQVLLAKIFDKYGYPGRLIVGDKFMDYACLIFEHGGNLDFQEKYFPVVLEASKNNQVNKGAVRMLVDRIHWKKTGKQIFGSHIGVPFDNDKVIQEVKDKYRL